MDLQDQVSLIRTREDFVAFLRKLLDDKLTKPAEWENFTLESYLEAMSRWIEDSDGYYANLGIAAPQQPSWKTFGEMFLAAKYYE